MHSLGQQELSLSTSFFINYAGLGRTNTVFALFLEDGIISAMKTRNALIIPIGTMILQSAKKYGRSIKIGCSSTPAIISPYFETRFL